MRNNKKKLGRGKKGPLEALKRAPRFIFHCPCQNAAQARPLLPAGGSEGITSGAVPEETAPSG